MRYFPFLLLAICSVCSSLPGLKIEIANTPETRAWGLMGRKHLAADQGMLFIFSEPRYHRVWSFNCFMDLDVAFLDDQGIILQLETLRAYPEKMALLPPIRNIDDLKKIDVRDPIVYFFDTRSVASKSQTRFFLEMPAGWFQQEKLKVGDRVPVSLEFYTAAS